MTDETRTLTREQELAEQFKEGLDPAGAAQLAARVDALEADRDALAANRDAVLIERDEAIARAEKAEAAATAAKAKVSRGETPAKARKIGDVDAKLEGSELSEAIDNADKVEIVFSDGAKELTQLAPVVIEGDVWRRHALGMMLRDPVTIHGPAQGGSGYQIDGYGLVLDGKQVAYCKRADPINVAPGQTYNLVDDIYFK